MIMNIRLLNPLQWKRGVLLSVLFFMLVVWFGFFDTYSLRAWIALEKEKKELVKESAHLLEETEKYLKKIIDLESDPELLIRLAREEYGMRKPDERVYRVQHP